MLRPIDIKHSNRASCRSKYHEAVTATKVSKMPKQNLPVFFTHKMPCSCASESSSLETFALTLSTSRVKATSGLWPGFTKLRLC